MNLESAREDKRREERSLESGQDKFIFSIEKSHVTKFHTEILSYIIFGSTNTMYFFFFVWVFFFVFFWIGYVVDIALINVNIVAINIHTVCCISIAVEAR